MNLVEQGAERYPRQESNSNLNRLENTSLSDVGAEIGAFRSIPDDLRQLAGLWDRLTPADRAELLEQAERLAGVPSFAFDEERP
jgi:hypothetical protein